MISLISSCYRAAGSLSGYWVPPPPLHHHPPGEGLRTRAHCCKVSQTHVAKVQFWVRPNVNVYPCLCCRPWIKDRFMSADIEAVQRLLLDQKASCWTNDSGKYGDVIDEQLWLTCFPLQRRYGVWPNRTLTSTSQSTSQSPAPVLPPLSPWTLQARQESASDLSDIQFSCS